MCGQMYYVLNRRHRVTDYRRSFRYCLSCATAIANVVAVLSVCSHQTRQKNAKTTTESLQWE